MCGIVGGTITVFVGAALIITSSIVGYVTIPAVINNLILNEVVLYDDTVQMERFVDIPFPLNFTIRMFNISNAEEVLDGGVPVVTEVGPYVYKLYQSRVIESADEETITYRRLERFEFDSEASYPNTEDDIVTVLNVPYHAILQEAERSFPGLMGLLSLALRDVFGRFNAPFIQVRIQDLLFNGLTICENPGLIGGIACAQIREIGANSKNLIIQENGSIVFSLLSYKSLPSVPYKVKRGINDSNDLARILTLNDSSTFDYWVNDEVHGEEVVSVCNMINGTDSGLFNPFISRDMPLYAINLDICRSVELRYQEEVEYKGIPALRFSVNEWFLDNDDGCFCLNVTTGLTRDDGCLLKGAIEMQTCVSAPLVLTYPHFLYADFSYRNGIIGATPQEDQHRIFLDLEPNTGTVVQGAKRAQYNMFLRPITSVSSTINFRTTLTPIAWFEEGMILPDEYVNQLRNQMLLPLNLINILLPIVIALSSIVFAIGIVVIIKEKLRSKNSTP